MHNQLWTRLNEWWCIGNVTNSLHRKKALTFLHHIVGEGLTGHTLCLHYSILMWGHTFSQETARCRACVWSLASRVCFCFSCTSSLWWTLWTMCLAHCVVMPSDFKTPAPCEARTHDLQIMRLTRCLLRQRGLEEPKLWLSRVVIGAIME